MTLPVLTFPLSTPDALQHLRDALGDNYGAATDDVTLTRALSVDAATVGGAAHPRPWATAARLIRDNTEYEVSKGLNARIDRKLRGLDDRQMQMDALAGILHQLPSTGLGQGDWPPASGSVTVESVF